MLIKNLDAWLRENKVNPDYCAIGQELPERYCIVWCEGGLNVFFSERGERLQHRRFSVEADAVRYLIELLTSDHAVMRRR